MIRSFVIPAVGFAWLACPGLVPGADELVPLPLKPATPRFFSSHAHEVPAGPWIEPPTNRPPPPFLAPRGVTNVALAKKVTTSVRPFEGEPQKVTDGKKEQEDGDVVEMRSGLQWVQVDLGASITIYAVAIWHDDRWPQLFHDVIVQVADDGEFTWNVKTLFNNDRDNSANLGIGTDKEYSESIYGRIFDAKGVRARYVRSYTNGGNLQRSNHCQEIEVYGLPPP